MTVVSMAEWRTAEQVQADEELAAAVMKVLAAYDDKDVDPNVWALTDYVVISARAGITDEKALNTRYAYSLSSGSIPWHSMMGLMDWGRMAMEQDMSGDTDG